MGRARAKDGKRANKSKGKVNRFIHTKVQITITSVNIYLLTLPTIPVLAPKRLFYLHYDTILLILFLTKYL